MEIAHDQVKILWHRLVSMNYRFPDPGFFDFDIAAIFSASKNDYIITQHPTDQAYLECLRELNFPVERLCNLEEKITNINDQIELTNFLKSFKADTYESFVTTDFEKKLASSLGISLIENATEVFKKDNKLFFSKILPTNVLQPDTSLLSNNHFLRSLQITRKFLHYNELIIKEVNGMAGQGQFRIVRKNLFTGFGTKKFSNIIIRNDNRISEFLVQNWIKDALASPSVQLEVFDRNIVIESIHFQDFYSNQMTYSGCKSQSFIDTELIGLITADALAIAKAYANSGYSGRIGLNAVIDSSGIYWVEANLRKVMSSYACDFSNHINLESRNINITNNYVTKAYFISNEYYRDIKNFLLKINTMLIKKNCLVGVFPLHFYNLKDHGMVTMIFYSPRDTAECQEIESNFNKFITEINS